MFNVVIVFLDGSKALLSHKGRMIWSKNVALKHKRDVMKGKTGIANFSHVVIVEE